MTRHPDGPTPRLARVVSWIVVLSAVEALPALFSGVLVAAAVDRGFLAGELLRGLLLLAALGGLQILGGLATRAVFPWLAALVEPLRDRLLRQVVAATIRTAVAGGAVDTAAVPRLTSQVELVRSLVSALTRTLRQGAVALLAALAGLALLDPALAWPVAGCVLLGAVLFVPVVRRLRARQREALLAGEDLGRDAGEVFGAVRDVVADNAQDRAAAELGLAVDAQARAVRSVARAAAGRTVVVAVAGYLPLLLLLVLLPGQLRRGGLTVGDAIGAVTYLTGRLLPAVTLLTSTVGSWLAQLGAVRHRLREVTGSDRAARGASDGRTAPATPVRAGAGVPAGVGLRLDGVTFRYGRYAAPVVDRLSLTVPPDGHLAVVGPSGIGKSTLSRLVSGELRPESGTVSLGGTPVSQLDPALRHRLVAVIPQEAYVFAGTLRENLRYLAGPGPDSELDAAAAATGLAPVVARVGGYDAVLGPDGEDLPAGARQLVALTRVHLSAARLVILDEATCHLDPATEAQVERAFAARPGLLVVIAHRLGSARRARQVLVLGEAEPVVGTPAEVLAASPLYAELADH